MCICMICMYVCVACVCVCVFVCMCELLINFIYICPSLLFLTCLSL